MMPCPTKLPHDIELGVSEWRSGSGRRSTRGTNVGKVVEVNKRRTKSENVSVEFVDQTYGETRGAIVATAETYGADKLWVVLKPIPIDWA